MIEFITFASWHSGQPLKQSQKRYDWSLIACRRANVMWTSRHLRAREGWIGDHFAVLIRGAIAADFRKGEKTREEITDLMAGGEHMAELEAEIETLQARV